MVALAFQDVLSGCGVGVVLNELQTGESSGLVSIGIHRLPAPHVRTYLNVKKTRRIKAIEKAHRSV